MTLAPPPPAAPAPPPVRWTTRVRHLVPPTLVLGTVTALTVALHLRDPHQTGTWGGCPFAAMGVWCPGCGGLRAVNDLTDLRLADAASSNLLFFCSLPLIAYAFTRWSVGRWTGRRWQVSERTITWGATAFLTALAVFTVLRNTPAGAWLAP